MKRLSKILLLAGLGCFTLGTVQGQKIASPAGGQYHSLYCQVEWTLGECAIQTYYHGPYILTEGFHQPELLITRIPDGAISGSEIKVYPNPTSDKFIISFTDVPPARTTARLYDGLGRLIASEDLHSTESVFSVASMPAGMYSLTVTVNNKEDHQFKIIKNLK